MFSKIPSAPTDAVFGVVAEYNKDTDPRKCNLSIGAYRDNDGKPVIFEAVKEAGRHIYAEGSTHNKEYLPMGGSVAFRQLSAELVFGKDSNVVRENRIATIQSVSGTGALTICGEFLTRFMPNGTAVYVSNPTWPNHNCIFGELLNFDVRLYPYWNADKKSADITAMIACLQEAQEGSIVILHACAHNPTGEDPTKDEWKQILDMIVTKKHFPILDSAYQGFATMDLERDAYAIRLFAQVEGLEFAVCQSYAKNMGLYGERAGALHYVCAASEEAVLVHGRLERLCRLVWSNPPKHGSELATLILQDERLRASWESQLADISHRIIKMRELLKKHLVALETPGSWDHITKQIGMFSYTGLTELQCKCLVEKHHVYLLKSGRISMAGINESNVEYIANAIDDAVRHC